MKEQIEDYFNGKLNAEEMKQFELEFAADSHLADETAFYLQAKTAAEQITYAETLKEKHQSWQNLADKQKRSNQFKWIAAAAAILIVFSIGYFSNWFQQSLSNEAAYIVSNNLKEFPVHLGEKENSIEDAIRAYNIQDYERSASVATEKLKSNPVDFQSLSILGLSQLQLKQYDQALATFKLLEEQNQYINNPGSYYLALTYLMRGQEDDESKAKELLQKVIQENLPGKVDAKKLIE